MHLTTRNVNTGFKELVEIFTGQSINHEPEVARRPSRNGAVLVIDEPVTITYTHPTERVLFNAARDANPFMHLYESLWMLAGRNDLASLAYYCKRMKDFSDDGLTLNGAYGYRWRHANRTGSAFHEQRGLPPMHSREKLDQLQVLINHLRVEPTSRRAVLTMWNVEDDLLKIGQRQHVEGRTEDGDETTTVYGASKDVCCNLNVMFSLREEKVESRSVADQLDCGPGEKVYRHPRYLDMTVTNRSNDLVWGLLGTNVVHFSILQEYVAAHLGAQVGKFHTFTNNLHAYVDRPDWRPDTWLESDRWSPSYELGNGPDPAPSAKGRPLWTTGSLITDPARFDAELPEFVQRHSIDAFAGVYYEPFLRDVAQPMCVAWHYHKRKETPMAVELTRHIKADDWRIACQAWLQRRITRQANVKGNT